MSKEPKLSELLAKRAALDAEIESTRKEARATAISQIRDLIAEFGLAEGDIFGSRARSKARVTTGSGVARFRDPATGRTWTGRGRPPKWLQGKDADQFKI